MDLESLAALRSPEGAAVLAMFIAPDPGYAYLNDPDGTLAALSVTGQA